MTTKFVIVTPGRVAFVSPDAKKKFTDVPMQVTWNNYLEELLNDHGDIEVVDPVEFLRARNAAKNAARNNAVNTAKAASPVADNASKAIPLSEAKS